MSALLTKLKRVGACSEAIKWAEDYPDLPSAWAACERGDWMLWLADNGKLCSREALVLAACDCARLSLRYVPAGELRPLRAIEAAESWARGEISLDLVRSAAYAAAAAAAYAADAAAAYAAYAAAYAAYAAAYAAYAAAYAADAAAAYAAYAAADAAARSTVLRECAVIVRTISAEAGWKVE